MSDTQNTSCSDLLKSVACITEQRDRDLLARTLVVTLAELINISRISLFRLLPSAQGEEAILMAEFCRQNGNATPRSKTSILISSRPDLYSAFTTGKESVHTLENNNCVTIYPIRSQHGVSGLMEVVSAVPNDTEKQLILALLKIYSNHLFILEESETDKLTGLLNRRTFDNNIEKIIAEHVIQDETHPDSGRKKPSRRSVQKENPHWLAMIDIDHFKSINDKFGHLYGDEVLLLLSRNMKRTFRQRDKLFRFGGEEFVVVLDRASLKNAQSVLERFRAEIEQFHFPQVGKVTISIGFVRMDKADVSSSIVGRADQALYYAKHHGRNQVCFYEDLIAQGKLKSERYSDDMQLF